MNSESNTLSTQPILNEIGGKLSLLWTKKRKNMFEIEKSEIFQPRGQDIGSCLHARKTDPLFAVEATRDEIR